MFLDAVGVDLEESVVLAGDLAWGGKSHFGGHKGGSCGIDLRKGKNENIRRNKKEWRKREERERQKTKDQDRL